MITRHLSSLGRLDEDRPLSAGSGMFEFIETPTGVGAGTTLGQAAHSSLGVHDAEGVDFRSLDSRIQEIQDRVTWYKNSFTADPTRVSEFNDHYISMMCHDVS